MNRDKKADANLAKHGVSFEDGSTVFGDSLNGASEPGSSARAWPHL